MPRSTAQPVDLAVIGGGVVGASTARLLADGGAVVVLLDADPAGGTGSRAAAGVGIPSIRLAGDAEMVEFATAGREQLDADLRRLTSDEPGLLRVRAGVLRLVRNAAHLDQLLAAMEDRPGWLGSWVAAGELAGVEPLLAGAHVHGAFLDDDAVVVDAPGYVSLLLDEARRAGAEVRLGCRVQGAEIGRDRVTFDTTAGRVDAARVVVAAGAWSGRLPGLPELPITPLRGQMLRLAGGHPRPGRVISGTLYAAPSRSGTTVVGATEEEAGFRDGVTAEGLMLLGAFLARTLPGLATVPVQETWSGFRSATPSGRPLLGVSASSDRVLVATGHGGQGILTGGLTGLAIAELLHTGESRWCSAFSASDRARVPA